LLGLRFVPFGVVPGSWNAAWDIPARGHISNGFTISAQDEANKSERAFSGIVGSRIERIKIYLGRAGRTVVVHPRLPTAEARRERGWLRGFRYFVRFLPTSDRVEMAKLIDSKGDVVATERPFEGVFEGSG
jgi:hypothetical protein